MTKAEKAEVLKALMWLADGLDRELSPSRQKFYLENLTDLPVVAILSGIQVCAKSSKFFPSVPELREICENGNQKERLEDQAALAWERLRNGKKGKAYDETALDDPIIHKCFLAMGGRKSGLTGFGMWNLDQETWKRKDFLALYQTYSRTMGQELKALSYEESENILTRFTEKGILKHGG